MDFSEKEVEYLAINLETRPVTYHAVSRDLGLPVHRSKKLLAEYYKSSKESLCATFVATGSRSDVTLIRKFQSEVELEKTLPLAFDEVSSVHIYCLRNAKNTFTSVDIALEELNHPANLQELTRYYELGLIKGPALVKSSGLKQRAQIKVEKASNSISSNNNSSGGSNKTVNEPSSKLPLVYRSSKPAVSAPTKPSLLSNYVSRKGESTAPKKRVSKEEKTPYQYKSRKTEKAEPKERVVIANVGDEDHDSETKRIDVQSSLTLNSNLNDLFLDDDFTDDEADTNMKEPSPEVESQPIEVDHDCPDEDELVAVQAPQLPQNSILRTMSAALDGSGSVESDQTRSVPRETTVDEDGYFTSYKQAEPEPKKPILKRPQPEPKKASSNKGDSKKKQASLMSFFGKR